jgi:hypothetical protein
MSATTTETHAQTFCVNHPQTETYMRCNRCNRPVCIKCVQRTPVGYRCNECLGLQRQGYYNATAVDHVFAVIVAFVLGGIGGFLMSLVGFWLLALFAGPIAGGIIAESIRRLVSKRRGRYLALTAAVALVLGGLAVLVGPSFLLSLAGGSLGRFVTLAPRLLFNIGFWIFLALAVSTTFARLRA